MKNIARFPKIQNIGQAFFVSLLNAFKPYNMPAKFKVRINVTTQVDRLKVEGY